MLMQKWLLRSLGVQGLDVQLQRATAERDRLEVSCTELRHSDSAAPQAIAGIQPQGHAQNSPGREMLLERLEHAEQRLLEISSERKMQDDVIKSLKVKPVRSIAVWSKPVYLVCVPFSCNPEC